MSRLDEAREVAGRVRALTLRSMGGEFFRKPEHRELFLSGLRLAMGETE